MGLLLGLSAAALLAAAAPAFAGTLSVAPDPRIDLVGLVQELSGDPAMARAPEIEPYLERFARWRSHPAVARLSRMRARGFAGDLPSNYAVYLATGPLREAYRAPSFFEDAAGGRAELDAWRGELDDFARASGFYEWEASTASPSGPLATALSRELAQVDLEAPLTDYLRVRSWRRWTVAPSPFFPPGATSSWVREETPELPDLFVVVGPEWKQGEPTFGPLPDLAQGVWAEAVFSTAYIMFDVCRDDARPAADACADTPGYTEAESCVQRQWVNAILERVRERARLDKPRRDPAFAVAPRRSKALARALDAYESDRGRYPDLVAAAGPLLAPFQADGRAPACAVVVSGERLPRRACSRRLQHYLEMRRAHAPDPELESFGRRLARASARCPW